MKVRIKFSKVGPVKFVGHLDTMRYFQKAIRRAHLPAAFSGGYSPHMIMSFAAPLGVGMEGQGEYFDLELAEEMPTSEIVDRLSRTMVDGITILNAVQVEDGKAGKAMSLVAAADYRITLRPGHEALWQQMNGKVQAFLSQQEIQITKTGKSGETQVNIRPHIYEMREEGEALFLSLASASSNYTRPDTVMEAFFSWLGLSLPPHACQFTRLEVYADKGTEGSHAFVPLDALGIKENTSLEQASGDVRGLN